MTEYLRDQNPETVNRLKQLATDFGLPVMYRVLELGDDRTLWRKLPPLTGPGAADIWWAAVEIVSNAHPHEYADWIVSHGHGTSEIAFLAKIEDPRMVEFAAPLLDSDDWLERNWAVSALAQHAPEEARPLIERALSDPEEVVRAEAILGVSRWDRPRTAALYREQLGRPGLTPLLTQSAEWSVTFLDVDQAVPDPLTYTREHPDSSGEGATTFTT